MTLSANHHRCDCRGNSAAEATSQTVNGSQIRSVSALLSRDRSAKVIASSNHGMRPRPAVVPMIALSMTLIAEESNRLRQLETARATTEAAERAGQRGDWEFAISLADGLLAAGQGDEIGLRLLRVEGLDALDRSPEAKANVTPDQSRALDQAFEK